MPQAGAAWAAAVSALIDGVDLVVVGTPGAVQDGVARRLMARARQRRCVLVPTQPWPGCQLVVRSSQITWAGLGHGRGRLRLQETTVTAAVRGRSEQPRTTLLRLPPPSIVKRVGPSASGIAGIPEDWIRNPDRTHGAPPGAVPVARPVAEDPWAAHLREDTALWQGRRAG
ncbi:hypothetical protein [Dactylosporangium sp. NPDC048998]|uniref:hypothetical protein n=1 Tax=Dactylosporangium sp. NPDC048998 TaxID=3363976 RepID=UPI00371C33AF